MVSTATTNQMGLSPSASCECGAATSQTAHHTVTRCPLHSCDGHLVVIDAAGRRWLRNLRCDIQDNPEANTGGRRTGNSHRCKTIAMTFRIKLSFERNLGHVAGHQ